MATEVVRGTIDALPVRTATRLPPPACTSSTRGRPAPPASRRYAPGRASARRSDRCATARRRNGDRHATPRRQPIRPVAKTVSYITPRRPRRAAVIPDSQGVCPAGGVRDKSARAIRIEGQLVGTTGARPVAESAVLPRSDTNIQRDLDHYAPARDVSPRPLESARRREGARYRVRADRRAPGGGRASWGRCALRRTRRVGRHARPRDRKSVV